jgi:hypothetical protein
LGLTLKGSSLGNELLDQHTDGHSGGKSIWVDNDVRTDSPVGNRHVLLRPQDRHDSLLTMSRRELVSHHWVSIEKVPKDGVLLLGVFLIRREVNSFDLTWLSFLIQFLLNLLGLSVNVLKDLLSKCGPGSDFDDSVGVNHILLLLLNQLINIASILLTFRTFGVFGLIRRSIGFSLEIKPFGFSGPLVLSDFDRTCLVDLSVHESSFVRSLVDYHTVLNIVACIGDNCDYCVGSLGVLFET